MRSLNQAVGVITGAGSGIGRALAKDLAMRGCALALCDVNEAGLEETRAQVGDGVRVTTAVVDAGDHERMTEFRDAVRRDFGRVSLLVNNAGVALYGMMTDLSLEDLEWIMRVNFWGPVYGCRLFLPMLLEEPEANIVTVSSIFGIVAAPMNSGYCASKFAVRGFSESLRRELGKTNVHVTVVHPGGIATNIARTSRVGAHADADAYKADIGEFEKGLVTSPEDAAATIVRAILKDAPRALIGNDARFVDIVQRFWPARYAAILGPLTDKEKRFRK